MLFVLEQLEEHRHTVAHGFSRDRHVTCTSDENLGVPVTSQVRGLENACLNARAEERAIPLPKSRLEDRARVLASDDPDDILLYKVVRLEIALCSHRAFGIPVVAIWGPSSASYALDEFGGDRVAFDGER